MPISCEIMKPSVGSRLGDILLQELADGSWDQLRASVAYAKLGGVRHVGQALREFVQRGGQTTITVGIDQQITSLEGLQTLWRILDKRPGSLYVLHNPGSSPTQSFHPKTWLFSNASKSTLICGSGNLTAAGLYTNHEFGLRLQLDLADVADLQVHDDTVGRLGHWCDESLPEVSAIDDSVLGQLFASGALPTEAAIRKASAVASRMKAIMPGQGNAAGRSADVFAPSPGLSAPTVPSLPPDLPPDAVFSTSAERLASLGLDTTSRATSSGSTPVLKPSEGAAPSLVTPIHDALLFVINKRSKTEIYLAKRFLDEDPAFFGWPFLGRTQPKRVTNRPQPQPEPPPKARERVYNTSGGVLREVEDQSLKLWAYRAGPSANDDFRMTLTGGIHSLIVDGSILVMRRDPPGEFDYDIDVFPPGHPDYNALLAECTRTLPGPQGRRYGWRQGLA